MEDILPSLVKPNQVGFIKGRQALDGTRRILNILQTADHLRTPSLFLCLDAEKAFDRLHWLYMHYTLRKFGFQGFITSAISALYSTPSDEVFTSGLLSTPFPIMNGTRQRCPLSPLFLRWLWNH